MDHSRYRYSTERKEGDMVVLPYKELYFQFKYHILRYYSKEATSDFIIANELERFYKSSCGVVEKSSISDDGLRTLMIKFNVGGNFHFDRDVYLNDCHLVKDEKDAKIVICKQMESAIKDLRKPLFTIIKERIKNKLSF